MYSIFPSFDNPEVASHADGLRFVHILISHSNLLYVVSDDVQIGLWMVNLIVS